MRALTCVLAFLAVTAVALANEGAAHGKLIFFDRAPDKGFFKHQLK